jgi:hypothetical protein
VLFSTSRLAGFLADHTLNLGDRNPGSEDRLPGCQLFHQSTHDTPPAIQLEMHQDLHMDYFSSSILQQLLANFLYSQRYNWLIPR